MWEDMEIEEWKNRTVDKWADHDGCPCASARRQHAEFVERRIADRENTPDINEPLVNLAPTKSGAELESQAVDVLGVLARVHERIDARIFGIRDAVAAHADESKADNEEPGDDQGFDSDRYSDEFMTRLMEARMRGEHILGSMNDEEADALIEQYIKHLYDTASEDSYYARVPAQPQSLEDILGSSTIAIVGKVELLDQGKFVKWIGGVKAAVSVIYKKGKTDKDILSASTKLAKLMTAESTKTFLRMLDSGLFSTIADKIDEVTGGDLADSVRAQVEASKPAAQDVPLRSSDLEDGLEDDLEVRMEQEARNAKYAFLLDNNRTTVPVAVKSRRRSMAG